MSNPIMIQGTSSGVGKSIITIGLCRIIKKDGNSVAPFKSQNVTTVSHTLENGDEMSSSQAIAAYAAEISPKAIMNPVLLKMQNGTVEVVINGSAMKKMTSKEYNLYKKNIWKDILASYSILDKKYEIIVIEGAGSPVEMNLRKGDISNMNMAIKAMSPVILVADIDRGGMFASVKGTLDLLPEKEQKMVKGIIINKCRGNMDSFNEVKRTLEEITSVPVLGAVPYTEINIEDEDNLIDEKVGKKEFDKTLSKNELLNTMNVEFDKLSKLLRAHLDMAKIYKIIEEGI